jgi:hypothetical protein
MKAFQLLAVMALSLLLVCTANADLVDYQLSGDVAVFDTQNMLGNGTDTYYLPLSGSFTVDTDRVDDDYAVTDFSLAIGDYTFSDPAGAVGWTQRDEDAVIGGGGLSSNLEDILSPLRYNYNVAIFAYGATPGDNSLLTDARIDLSAEQAGPGASRFTFNGHFDEFEIVSAPVPVPAAIWLLGSGLIGLIGFRSKKR